MTRAFVRLLTLAFAVSCLLPLVTATTAGLGAGRAVPVALTGLALAATLGATVLVRRLLLRVEPAVDADAREQAAFLDALPLRYVDVAIAGAAGLSLFLELAMIRWQGTVFEVFAFYKNFGLLACFAGLGLGYALAARDRIPLILVIPLLGWQFALLIGVRFGMPADLLESLTAIPVVEQLNMGVASVQTLAQGFSIYFFLSIVFLLTALAFVPVGQLCGRLMGRRPDLRGYGLNLLGSLGGVVVIFLLSSLWTPPVVWFAIAFAAILVLSAWRPATLVPGLLAAAAGVTILAWPIQGSARIYSPYQILELGYSRYGWMEIRAAGHYYQRVHDLTPGRDGGDSTLLRIRQYYDLPYRLHRAPADVAVVGAGAGNDVAAALRAGAARVDAIEIDPAILRAGRDHHPERPYRDRRVYAVVDDARSFLRTTDRQYDVIAYGMLDSHTLLSHAASVRLDSFVYTVEGFRDARARLKPGGVLVVSFSLINTALGLKMREMIRQAFDGAIPVVVWAGYDGAVVFAQSREATFALQPGALDGTVFQDVTSATPPPGIHVDASTDDWPFFYMPRRVYPVSYLIMLGLVLLGAAALTATFVSERPRASEARFLFLGAGFMLVETKAITELGLTFGNTWQVIGIVIGAVLLMAFLANGAVQMLNVRRPYIAYLLLGGTIGAGWLVTGTGGLPATTAGRLATAVLLTAPMFFSGIVFSTLLAGRGGGAVATVMAANLVGAMLGGLVEYNSMYFGFRFLYLLAIGFYALAFVSSWLPRPAGTQAAG